jgi:predicted transcriptional regulator
MKTETNKELILGSLLGSPKTTGQLARELNYVKNGIAGYSTIGNDLQDLVENGYIEGEKVKSGKRGIPPTLYSIALNIQNLKLILEEYPRLMSKMQKNASISKNILSHYSDIIYGSTDSEYCSTFGENGNEGWSLESRELFIHAVYSTSDPLSDSLKKDWEENSGAKNFENTKRDFEKKLQLSPEFFRLFLTNDKNKLMMDIKQLAELSENNIIYLTDWDYDHHPDNSLSIFAATLSINIAFEACVSMDIIKGQSNREAIQYLTQKKNEIPDAGIAHLRNYYMHNKLAPNFLKGKKLIPVKNPKLEKIEQEFEEHGGNYMVYYTPINRGYKK